MNADDIQETFTSAIQKLKKEIEKEPISTERVSALTNTIEVLSRLSPLKLR